MYSLPPHFNTGLLNSTFKLPVPVPLDISPANERPLQGMFDTNQFALERIFFDRMELACTEMRPANQCVMFYVPYFVAWETSATNNVWINAHRPALDRELFSHLSQFNSSGLPGRNHFIVMGRVSYNTVTFLSNPLFVNMVKLVLEDSDPGNFTNVFAVPYPTWFRYYPSLEPTPAAAPVIQVHSAAQHVNLNVKDCNPAWLGNLTARMSSACNGRASCSFFITPVEDQVSVQARCPIYDVFGQYSCGDGLPLAFKTVPADSAVGHAVVLSCHRGPCWLWGACSHPGVMAGAVRTRVGPMATVIGSARPTEFERSTIFEMCRQRPKVCAVFNTGQRENSSTFVHSRVPDMYQLLMASTFCVNPPGDTPTRKGLFDSLIVGCIPVVTSEDSLQHYKFHIPGWRSISVLVTTEQLFAEGFNLFDYLEAYERDNPHEVWQKQEAIRKAAYSLQYSLEPAGAVMRGPDAFDKILENMLSRPTSTMGHHDFPSSYKIVSLTSRRKLFVRAGDADHQEDFGASALGSSSIEQLWQLWGRGDGSCCYSLVNVAAGRALYAKTNATDAMHFGATRNAEAIHADQKWRLTAQGDGTFTISNVASGRRLFARQGQEGFDGLGATLFESGSFDQRWQIVPTR